MTIDHERVEAVAADLRELPPDPETRLLALAEAWREASADELSGGTKRGCYPQCYPNAANHPKIMVSRKGFEPLTYGLGNRCSILLSYREPTLP